MLSENLEIEIETNINNLRLILDNFLYSSFQWIGELELKNCVNLVCRPKEYGKVNQ